MNLRIASNLSLPKEASTWVLAFLAKRGAGKTYAAADLAEEMVHSQIPIVVIDGMGIWWGLRVSKDGKSDGLPIVVFGGEHADLPLIPDKAQQMARAIVESNISCVLDLSGFSKGLMKKILATFLDELYKLNRIDRHVFIEEADMFAPQKTIGPEDAICAGSVSNFVRRGGNHNLGCTMITQRSAVLNKDVLTQADCLVILRTLAPQDKKAIQLWVEEMTDQDKTQLGKWFDSLKELDNGEAWVWHPENPAIYKKIHFRERETFHATRENLKTPEAGKIRLMNVEDFVTKFKAVFEPKLKELAVQPKASWVNEPKAVTPSSTMQSPIGTQPGVPVSTSPKVERLEVRSSEPVVPTGNSVTVEQALPNIVIQQFKPDIGLTAEMLDQPTTALGKVCVILNNDDNNPGKWTLKRIVKDIQDHGWDAGDSGDAVNQLIRWEVLVKRADNYLQLHRGRIKVVNNGGTLKVE